MKDRTVRLSTARTLLQLATRFARTAIVSPHQGPPKNACIPLLSMLMLLGSSLPGLSQSYSLTPDRLPGGVLWKRSDVGVIGGLNTSAMPVYVTLQSTASASQINSAIQSCPAGHVVVLGAGIFTLDTSIVMKSGVDLRGAGPDVTVLNFTGSNGSGLVSFPGPFQDPGTTVANWTGGLSQGSTAITVSSASGFAVGDLIGMDQLNDASIGNSVIIDSGQSRAGGTRAECQYNTITAISGNTITVARPVMMANFKSSLNPQIWQIGNASSIVSNAGIENLTVNDVPGNIDQQIIYFQGCSNCWVNNVHSMRAESYHVHTYQCSRIEVRHSRFQYTLAYASSSYGVYLWYASNCLVEDNIFDTVSEANPTSASSSGNIIAYNFVTNSRYDVSPTWLVETVYTHGAYACMNLYEGNYTPDLYFDFIHGPGGYNTAFRNRVLGTGVNNGTQTNSNTYPIVVETNNWSESFVGNVLGTAGFHNTYELAGPADSGQQYIYVLGYADTNHSTANYDKNVAATVVRAANYNYSAQAVDASEAIGNQTLPASWYYSGPPPWWNGLPWPWVDKGNPGQSNSITNFPAGYRWKNGVDPTSTGTPTPAPIAPANLRVVVP